MCNCSVYQLKNYSLRSCRELAFCTAMAGKGDSSVKIYNTMEITLLPGPIVCILLYCHKCPAWL
jgi:hypothetical protein